MSERQKLLERVEKATGQDRELDAEITRILSMDEGEFVRHLYTPGDWYVGPKVNRVNRRPVPAYTASIDAALALVERVVPGWAYQIVSPRKDRGFEGVVIRHHPHTVWCSYHDANAPLAILAALLKALVAQEAVNA